MCGITACIGTDATAERLLTGLENLEYRGYDSAGIALQNGHAIEVRKREGEVAELASSLRSDLPGGSLGIGHTRWSTHGPPTDANAHPHVDCTGDVAVVHNGIIENHVELRDRLTAAGHEFTSETDTEVVPHLVEWHLADGHDPGTAFRRAVSELSGSFALVALVEGTGTLYAARDGSPLVLGIGGETEGETANGPGDATPGAGDRNGEYYLASDVPAFLEFTDEVVFLQDGDVAEVTAESYAVTDLAGTAVDRSTRTVDWSAADARKGEYSHFMRKEIDEQPVSLRQAVRGRIDPDTGRVALEDLPASFLEDVDRVHLVACGTSYHAAVYGARLFAARGVPSQAFLASEYTSAAATLGGDALVVGVTQSGETADTLGALERARAESARTLALTNVVGSTAARQCDASLFIRAGPEIGVAATKTFSSQVVTLLLLAELLDQRGTAGVASPDLARALHDLPDQVEAVLDGSGAVRAADTYLDREAYFFLGRELGFPVALEGALKFKEITYEHAEGFAAGELKHGPLALVTPDTLVFAVFTGASDEKLLNNVEEVQARGATVVGIAPESSRASSVVDDTLAIPEVDPDVAGVLANVQLQLVAYHAADRLGRAIDKPRNLAKSVTVE
jgi:glucosamine--fructose-6-phosphate aminotransferase (isomerizing)